MTKPGKALYERYLEEKASRDAFIASLNGKYPEEPKDLFDQYGHFLAGWKARDKQESK